MITLGTLNLSERPRAAIALQAPADPAAVRAAAGEQCAVELRLDQFDGHTTENFLRIAREYAGLPRLATIRWAPECGGWRGGEEERLACYQALLPEVEAVDVEINATACARTVFAAAREAGRLTIGSFHDFDQTPEDDVLEDVHGRGRSLGADIVKIAARCNSREDLQRLAAFTLAHRHENIITIGMGPWGMSSRIFFPALGSLLTYTFLGEPTAPGQLNCTDTLKYLDAFYPKGS